MKTKLILLLIVLLGTSVESQSQEVPTLSYYEVGSKTDDLPNTTYQVMLLPDVFGKVAFKTDDDGIIILRRCSFEVKNETIANLVLESLNEKYDVVLKATDTINGIIFYQDEGTRYKVTVKIDPSNYTVFFEVIDGNGMRRKKEQLKTILLKNI